MPTRDYDSTIARMAGNIAAGLVTGQEVVDGPLVAQIAVSIARMIVVETRRTEPQKTDSIPGAAPLTPHKWTPGANGRFCTVCGEHTSGRHRYELRTDGSGTVQIPDHKWVSSESDDSVCAVCGDNPWASGHLGAPGGKL